MPACQNNLQETRISHEKYYQLTFNELVQIDHQKICASDSGYTGILVMIDHYTKLVEAAPCTEYTAEETCRILINNWISRYGTPDFIQSDNGVQFTADLTMSLLKRSQISQIFSTPC